MHKKKQKRCSCLLFFAVICLALLSYVSLMGAKQIQAALLLDKYSEITNSVNILASVAETNSKRLLFDREASIQDSMELLETVHQIQCYAYKVADGEFAMIQGQWQEKYQEQEKGQGQGQSHGQGDTSPPFDPLGFQELREAADSQDSGSLVVPAHPGARGKEMHLYFRWMPLNMPAGERSLLVACVSQESLTSAVPFWASVGPWICISATFIINICLFILASKNICQSSVEDF